MQRLIDAAIDEEDEGRRETILLEAHGIASDWVEAEPNNAEAHYWLAATLGLRAEISGPRSKIRLGREAFEMAERGVELDSLHAGSLHVLGRVHAGARGLNWFTRLIAGRLGLGEVLDAASWESAEAFMARAVDLEPANPVFRFELGSFYFGREEWERAREHLLGVLVSPGFATLPASARRRTCEMLQALAAGEACTAG